MELSAEQYQPSVPKNELTKRITGLQRLLEEKRLDGALIVEKTDLFYFSGTSQQGWLFVPVNGQPILMVFKEYERATVESSLDEIVSISSTKKIVPIMSDYGVAPLAKLGLELDVLPANQYFQYQKLFNQTELHDISQGIRLLRAVKSEYEITKIRKAAALSDKVAANVINCLCEGKTEITLAGELEGYARSLGHQGLIRMRMFNNELYYGHLLSGDGAAIPSYLQSPTGGKGVSRVIGQGAGYRKILKNEPVLVDYVFALDGYLSDHARIFSIGKLDDELTEAHGVMVGLQDQMKPLFKPGTATGELYDEMVSRASKAGYEKNFMGVGERRIRFTGHGVGLELDEFPFIAKGQKLELQEGMVLALEPKTIFPGKGVVGIENTHLVTDKGLEPLSSYPDSITVI